MLIKMIKLSKDLCFLEPETILRFIEEQLLFLSGLNDSEKEKKTRNVVELLQDLQAAMTNCLSVGKRIIIVIDGINKVEENVKTHLVRKLIEFCLF